MDTTQQQAAAGARQNLSAPSGCMRCRPAPTMASLRGQVNSRAASGELLACRSTSARLPREQNSAAGGVVVRGIQVRSLHVRMGEGVLATLDNRPSALHQRSPVIMAGGNVVTPMNCTTLGCLQSTNAMDGCEAAGQTAASATGICLQECR